MNIYRKRKRLTRTKRYGTYQRKIFIRRLKGYCGKHGVFQKEAFDKLEHMKRYSFQRFFFFTYHYKKGILKEHLQYQMLNVYLFITLKSLIFRYRFIVRAAHKTFWTKFTKKLQTRPSFQFFVILNLGLQVLDDGRKEMCPSLLMHYLSTAKQDQLMRNQKRFSVIR